MITSLIIIVMTIFIEMKDDNILVIVCLSSYYKCCDSVMCLNPV